MTSATGGWDVHSHLVPSGLIEAARRGAFGMEIISNSLRAGGHSIPLELTSSVEQLENAISAGGLEGAIVSIPPLLFRTDLQGDECCEYVRVINDALYQDCCRSTNKLRPLAYAPLQLPEI